MRYLTLCRRISYLLLTGLLANCRSERVAFQFQPAVARMASPAAPPDGLRGPLPDSIAGGVAAGASRPPIVYRPPAARPQTRAGRPARWRASGSPVRRLLARQQGASRARQLGRAPAGSPSNDSLFVFAAFFVLLGLACLLVSAFIGSGVLALVGLGGLVVGGVFFVLWLFSGYPFG